MGPRAETAGWIEYVGGADEDDASGPSPCCIIAGEYFECDRCAREREAAEREATDHAEYMRGQP